MEEEKMDKNKDLESELAALLNNAASASDTPDFILAAYLTDCLVAFNRATTCRTKWHEPQMKGNGNI